MSEVRILNAGGVQKFREYLRKLGGEPTAPPPVELLEDPATSETLGQKVEVEPRKFASRLEAGRYLYARLGGIGGVEVNTGLWSWLALFYFDQLCPPDGSGQRRVREEARYIPDESFQRYYRHLLAGPFRIYQYHKEDAKLLLSGPLHEHSDFVEQLASRQEFVTNRGILGAATLLYFDDRAERPKRGAAPKQRRPGTLRRFVDLIQQLDLTYDLYSMRPGEILRLLPREFDAWRPR